MRLEDALAPWLQEQRWFAGKGRMLRDLAVVADTEVVAGDPALRHLLVLVSHGASADHYQIFVGLRRDLPD
jgi:maltokinase